MSGASLSAGFIRIVYWIDPSALLFVRAGFTCHACTSWTKSTASLSRNWTYSTGAHTMCPSQLRRNGTLTNYLRKFGITVAWYACASVTTDHVVSRLWQFVLGHAWMQTASTRHARNTCARTLAAIYPSCACLGAQIHETERADPRLHGSGHHAQQVAHHRNVLQPVAQEHHVTI